MTLRQAALFAGVGLLIASLAASFAEFVVYPRVVIAGDIEETARNILANRKLLLAGIASYLVTFICDLIVAWALFFLLAPVNRSVSLLAAWFRLVHVVIALAGLLNLVVAFRLLDAPDYLARFGADQLLAQVQLLIDSFRSEWSFSLVFFGIHLVLAGYLVHRSGYIPGILGILLAVAGLGHLVYCLGPYIYPEADVRIVMIAFLGELAFMIWLLGRGWRIQEPAAAG